MKLKVNASTMVKPTTATPSAAMWISNLDIILPANFHVLTVYFYPSTGANNFFDTAVLKASLSRALVEFYPLAGRLKKDANGRIEIDCNDEGVLFVEAECDGTVADFGDFTPRPEIDLIPKVDYSQGISTFPLLLVQVTRFSCGGLGFAFATEHHLMDGFASIHFINTWAAIARGDDIATKPFLDRRVLSACSPPQPLFPHVEYHSAPTLKNPMENSDAGEMIFSVFKLTRDQLNALKAKCKGDEGNKVKYTTYETLAGHIWRCVTKARGLPEDQETKFYIPVDGRSRLQPSLPPGYFGNVVFKATTAALSGELESNLLEFAVAKVHEAIARMDDEYLRSALDYLEKQALDQRTLGVARYNCPNLALVSWARFDFYDADFGWGRPIHLGFGGVPPEGNTILLPSSTDDGSLLYAIVLPKEQMQVFEKIFFDI